MNPIVDTSADADYSRPRDPVELWLARRWEDVLGFGVGIRESFFGIGGNSLDAARVINFVLHEFDVQLPLNVVTENPTVESLAALLRDQNGRALSAPLVEIQGGDGRYPPLFMVHPASGQVGPYCHLARALGDDFTLFGLQAVGLYADTEPIGTVAAMATAYVEAVRAVEPAGPYLLGGCSTGSAIAFEMACQLAGTGAEIRLLAAIDPGLVEPTDGRTESWLRRPEERQLPQILDGWKKHDLVPDDETPDFVARSLRVWRANHDAVRGWRPRAYPGTLDVFRARTGEQPPAVDWPASARRVHECAGTHARQLAAGLRKLIG
jgi:thioesterase domain-containing protein